MLVILLGPSHPSPKKSLSILSVCHHFSFEPVCHKMSRHFCIFLSLVLWSLVLHTPQLLTDTHTHTHTHTCHFLGSWYFVSPIVPVGSFPWSGICSHNVVKKKKKEEEEGRGEEGKKLGGEDGGKFFHFSSHCGWTTLIVGKFFPIFIWNLPLWKIEFYKYLLCNYYIQIKPF